MQISSLVAFTFATAVFGTNTPSITQCQTITSTIDPYGQFSTCTVLACLEIKPVTQKCGCPPVETTSVQATACPTSCGSTSYITAVEDCFPTPPPSSTTTTPVTTTKSPYHPPDSTHPTIPPHSSSSKPPPPDSSSTTTPHETLTTTPPTHNPYTNTTKTVTTTEHSTTTLTTCPPKHACTGETVTVTSTEPCPTSTCVCVLPVVTYTTTVLPGQTQSQEPQITTSPPSSSQPSNTPPTPRPTASLIESSEAGKFGLEFSLGMFGALLVAVGGFL